MTQNSETKSEGQIPQKNKNQTKNNILPSIDPPPNSIHEENNTSDSKTKYPEKNKNQTSQNAIKRATIVIAIATVVNVGIACFQWNTTSGQLDQMKSSSEQSERAAQIQNRAYVYAKPGYFYGFNTANAAQAYIFFGNSGNTFAINVKRFVGMRVLEPPGTDNIDDLKSMMDTEEGLIVMSPKTITDNIPIIKELPNRYIFTDKDIDAIKEGSKRVYVFGEIVYEDIYGNKHTSGFSYMYYGTETVERNSRTAYADFQAKYCEKHNYVN